MTIRSKSEYIEYINSILPDNTARLISPEDIRIALIDLADSVGQIMEDTDLVSSNFATPETRTTKSGKNVLSQLNLTGRTSVDNSAFGYESLNLNYDGARNTSIGSLTLSCNSFGSDNVAVGFNALGANTVGSGNVSVGSYSSVSRPRGNFNIAIGHGAAYYVREREDNKFYLGAYPNASGDCDTIDHSGIPPLLYGDLQTRQLGVGTDILVDENVGLAVSGDILPASGQAFSIGRSDYRFDAYLNNVSINGTIDVPLAWQFDLSDQFGTSGTIDKDDTIYVSGVSGIETFYNHSSRVMAVSAQPISGWASGNFSDLTNQIIQISGKDGQLLSLSGQLDNVSGWTLYNLDQRIYPDFISITGANGIIDRVSGWADYNQNAISGFNGLLNQLSGIDDGLIYQASGWSRDEITSVSGFDRRQDGSVYGLSGVLADNPNGLIYLASGWNKKYTDDAVLEAGSFTFWEIEGEHGASGMIHHADTLRISGVSGVETRMIVDEGAGNVSFYNLAVSAHPLSGWTSGVFTQISGVGGIIEEQVTASAVLISGWASDIARYESDEAYSLSFTEILTISGYDAQDPQYGPSGIIWSVSGHNEQYTDTASGWSFSNFESLSGVGSSQFGASGLIYMVSGFARSYTDQATQDAGSYTYWNIDGENEGSADVRFAEHVFISGVSGLNTHLYSDGTLHTLAISASGLSGQLVEQLGYVSGYYESQLLAISGFNGSVSGAIRATAAETLTAASEDANTKDGVIASNLTSTGTVLLAEINKVSGLKDGTLALTSGWAYGSFNALSGIKDGLIYLASGWNKQYTIDQINAITFPNGESQYTHWFLDSDRDGPQAIGTTRTVNFSGKDGLETSFRNEEGVFNLDISASALSGLTTDGLLEISGVGGILDRRFAAAGAEGNIFSFNISDRTNSQQIVGGDVINIDGKCGVDILVSEVDTLEVSACSLSGYLKDKIDSVTSRLDCLIDINCPGGAVETSNNISGWVQHNLSTLSGVDTTIYGPSGLIWSVSGYLDREISNKFVDSDNYGWWNVSDGASTFQVETNETVYFTGVKGLDVSLVFNDEQGTFTLDASPLSGVLSELSGIMRTELLAISGVADGEIQRQHENLNEKTLYASINNQRNKILDAHRLWISGQLLQISGYDPQGLLYQASGWNQNYTLLSSGANNNYTALVSGWADYSQNKISGVNGLLRNVSGWAEYSHESISGIDGQFGSHSGWNNYNYDVIYGELNEISGVGGLLDNIDVYEATSGIRIDSNNIIHTHGSGHFDKVITSRISDANDPSGQIVSNTGVYHDIVNSSGYLIVPRYESFSDLKLSIPASPANSGAIAFAGDYIHQSNGSLGWTRPTTIEGFLSEQLLSAPSYNNPTSGRMIVKNDQFNSDYEVYLTNRDYYLSISGGLFAVATLVNGEYRPIYNSCSGV